MALAVFHMHGWMARRWGQGSDEFDAGVKDAGRVIINEQEF